MLKHRRAIGRLAPKIVNVVVEIPRTHAMTEKREVNLHDGTVQTTRNSLPPLATYWHYGAIPETVGDEGEPIDAVLVDDGTIRTTGDEVEARIIGVFRAIDGWETKDDKIILVPTTSAFGHIHEVDDLPPIDNPAGQRSFKSLMDSFVADYRAGDGVVWDGWGNAHDAIQILEAGMRRYACIPLADELVDAHTFPLYQHIFLPPPLKDYSETFYVEDAVDLDSLITERWDHPDYGNLVSGLELKRALRAAGHAIGRSRLRGHDRERLIAERLAMADLLMRHGCKVFTATNDRDWLRLAGGVGVIGTYVDHEEYAVENVAGISALDLWTIHYRRADGVHVVIAEHGVEHSAVEARLVKIGVRRPQEECIVLNAPDRMVPWEVPARHPRRVTQLSNWIDYGFNIWPDRQNRPHLVVGEAVARIADLQGRRNELEGFLELCRTEFRGVHILELAEGDPYGAPTNSIDVGSAILSNTALAEACRVRMERILQRPIDNTLRFAENVPGFRCAVFPVDKSAYSLLVEGDPLHHASVDRALVDPMDPMDPFFDVHGPEHQSLSAQLLKRREELDQGRPSPDGRRRGGLG